jgi:hypothetical protein
MSSHLSHTPGSGPRRGSTAAISALVAGCAACVLVAWRIGGAEGVGAALGATVATAAALAGTVAQARAFARRPDHVPAPLLGTLLLGTFLAKLALLAGGALALAELDGWSERADPTGYLLGFAAAVLASTVVAVALPVRAPSIPIRTPAQELPTP